MRKYTNEAIIQGILNHNKEILHYIYKDNYRKIKQLIITNSGSSDEAEDVFQESIIVIYSKVRKNELTLNASFGTYLYSVARTIWLNELKRKKNITSNEVEVDRFVDEDNILYEFEQNEKHKLVWQYFEKLTDDCKKIIRYFLDGRSITEVTELMAFSTEQHTKNRRLRCKNTLIEHVMNDPIYKELKASNKIKDGQVNRW